MRQPPFRSRRTGKVWRECCRRWDRIAHPHESLLRRKGRPADGSSLGSRIRPGDARPAHCLPAGDCVAYESRAATHVPAGQVARHVGHRLTGLARTRNAVEQVERVRRVPSSARSNVKRAPACRRSGTFAAYETARLGSYSVTRRLCDLMSKRPRTRRRLSMAAPTPMARSEVCRSSLPLQVHVDSMPIHSAVACDDRRPRPAP